MKCASGLISSEIPPIKADLYRHLRLDTGGGCGKIFDGPHSLALSPASGPGFNGMQLGAGERENRDDIENPGRRSPGSLALGYFL